jgi:hypothetical protein
MVVVGVGTWLLTKNGCSDGTKLMQLHWSMYQHAMPHVNA